jgi:preprotein translocase subunit YajC
VSGGGILLIVLAFVFLYFVLVRPQKRRQVEHARLLDKLEVGDEVVTAGGIYGHVTNVEGDDLMVEIAPQLEVRVARRAIGGVIKPADAAEADEVDEVDEHETENAPHAEEPEAEEPRRAPEPPTAEDGG